MDLDTFVVNPSINVSPYCYSILRVEPYSTCGHRCVYCFGRWYRVESAESIDFDVVRGFKRILKFLRRRNLRMMPFRLSTLVDPFQPIEEERHLSRHIMNLCLKYETPLIINTKATLLLKDDNLLRIMMRLSDRGLVIVQVSFSTINTEIARVLEPNAPQPIERFDMVEKISRENVPVIIRLQPFIPGITDHEVEDIIRQSRYAGVKQIIVEALRDDIENLRIYEKLAYEKVAYEDLSTWSPYSPSVKLPSKIIRPGVEWKIKVYARVKSLCDKHRLEFSTCKEGLYNYHTARNCCGMHYIWDGKYALRPTLYEVWKYYERQGEIPSFNNLLTSLDEAYIFGDEIKQYPRPLRKKMLSHEKILREVLKKRRDMIGTLLPALS
jgi:DNA repair photolyase